MFESLQAHVELRRRSCELPRQRRARGFTMVELLTVVVIVGVLATLGVVTLRNQVSASRGVEAVAVVQAIRAAEERFRAENKGYLNVSANNVYYPQNRADGAAFDGRSFSFQVLAHPDLANWQTLGATVNMPVQFGYRVNAGAAGVLPPLLDGGINPGAGWLVVPNEPWFVIQAKSDLDADGVVCRYVGTSFSSELFSVNEGE